MSTPDQIVQPALLRVSAVGFADGVSRPDDGGGEQVVVAHDRGDVAGTMDERGRSGDCRLEFRRWAGLNRGDHTSAFLEGGEERLTPDPVGDVRVLGAKVADAPMAGLEQVFGGLTHAWRQIEVDGGQLGVVQLAGDDIDVRRLQQRRVLIGRTVDDLSLIHI